MRYNVRLWVYQQAMFGMGDEEEIILKYDPRENKNSIIEFKKDKESIWRRLWMRLLE